MRTREILEKRRDEAANLYSREHSAMQIANQLLILEVLLDIRDLLDKSNPLPQ